MFHLSLNIFVLELANPVLLIKLSKPLLKVHQSLAFSLDCPLLLLLLFFKLLLILLKFFFDLLSLLNHHLNV